MSDSESKFGSLSNGSALQYTAAGGLYSYPIYAGGVLRVPPQRGCAPLSWALPPLHPAALAHQAVKDRLAGKWNCFAILAFGLTILILRTELLKASLFILY